MLDLRLAPPPQKQMDWWPSPVAAPGQGWIEDGTSRAFCLHEGAFRQNALMHILTYVIYIYISYMYDIIVVDIVIEYTFEICFVEDRAWFCADIGYGMLVCCTLVWRFLNETGKMAKTVDGFPQILYNWMEKDGTWSLSKMSLYQLGSNLGPIHN